jgi:cobalt/nickel transport system ATP-binding protein
VHWALESVGLLGLSEKSPHHLSFGQRKRASLATVLSMRPMVLVLDEPTSNLDPRSKIEMISLIRKLQVEGTTIITATHDVNTVPLLADGILLLNRRLVSNGEAREILQKRDPLKELGLEMPLFADLFEELRADGGYSGPTPFTKEEAKAALKIYLQKK